MFPLNLSLANFLIAFSFNSSSAASLSSFLIDLDSYLKVPDEKLKYKYVQSVKSLVVGINSFLDKPLKFEEVRDFFVDFIVNYFKSDNPLVLDMPKQLKDNAKVEYGKRYFDNAWHLKF